MFKSLADESPSKLVTVKVALLTATSKLFGASRMTCVVTIDEIVISEQV